MTVQAGIAQTINLPVNKAFLKAVIDSFDSIVVSVTWTQIVGTGATIESPGSLSTTISNLQVGENVFRVRVVDNYGVKSFSKISVTLIGYITYPKTWIEDPHTLECEDGLVRIIRLLRVSDDNNRFPLNYQNFRVDQMGGVQDSKPNSTSDPDYMLPYSDSIICS